MNTITFHGSKCHIVFGWPPPPEKDEVKQLGAKWNPRDKVWIAPITYELAEWLRQHGVEIPADVVVPDPPVPELPEGESLEEILAESWATDADIEIPAPNGVDYRPFQKAGIAWALKRPGALIGDDMGLGKQQPVSEPVLTPEGWRSIGSLSAGDHVIGSDGQATKVLAVYPQQCRDVYRVEFSDGSSTRCGPDHLWTVRKIQSEDTTYHTMTTQNLIDIGLEVGWALPLVAPVSFDPVTLPVDPYHLGVAVSESVGANSEASVVQAKLEGLGIGDALAQDRSIPPPYLRASPKDRLALLQGILDSEGRPTPHGGFEIRLTSHALANEVRELVQSLGGVAQTTYDRKGRPAWRINARLPANLCPFREADKRLAWTTPTHYPPSRYIARIVLDVPEDSVCIRVEAKDHLYVTRDYIVTHNTIQALGVVNADPDVGSALIVCPLSVALNWRNEAAKWLAREMSVGVATSKEFPDTDIVIVHWGILAKHTDALRMRDWDLIALDEAHYAKNPRAKRTQAIFGSRSGDKALTAKHKLALTGTPIPNRPIELYPLLNWLAPRQFDNWFNYASKYCAAYKTRYGWDVSGASNLDELQENLRMIMIRRLKKDVLTELPPKTRQVILLDADTPELRAVLHSEAVAQKETEEAITKARIDVELAKAQGPEVYKEAVEALNSAQGLAFTEISRVRHETALAKIPQVLTHVKDILDNEGQKVIVFAHHRDVIEQLRNGLEAGDGDTPGVKTVSIVGGDSPEDRQEAIDSFQNDPATRVFLGSIGAAKEGITLTAADISIFAELDWVPGNLSQAEDRCVAEGTPVLTPTGWVPIEKVNIGDLVVTHTGEHHHVLDTHRRGAIEAMAELRVSGWPESFVTTHDHRYLLDSGVWRMASELRPGDWLAISDNTVTKDCTSVPFNAERCPAKFTGSFGAQANGRLVSAPSSITVTDDFLFMLGYYIGDGFTSIVRDKGAFVSLAGHRTKKRAAMERCVRWFTAQGVARYHIKNSGEYGVEYRFYSRDWANWFSIHAGRICNEKHLPSFALQLNPRQSRVILDGLAASDGYDRKLDGRIEYTTKTATLAAQVLLLAQRAGLRAGLRYQIAGHHIVSFGGPGGPRAAGRVQSVMLRHPRKTANQREMVYDLTVEKDHSFMIGHTIVHNCYRIGQRNSVLVQHLLVDGSIDALMADTILAKQAVLDEALDQRHEGTVTALPDRAPAVNPNSSLIFAQAENGNTWEAKAEGETRSPVEDANDAATSGLPLSEVAKRAEWITPDEIQMVHKGLRLLSGMDWDHAQEVNGIGFSKIDVGIGHDLAGRDTLSPKQAALGAKLTNKYRRQLPEECSRVWNDLKDRMVQAPEIAKEVEDGDKGLEVPVQLGFGLRRGLRCWTHI